MQLYFRKLNGNQSADFLNQNKHALAFRLYSHLSRASQSITVTTITAAGWKSNPGYYHWEYKR